MFVVVIFHLFYLLVKICVVFVVELNVNVIPIKYGRELTLTRYMHLLQRSWREFGAGLTLISWRQVLRWKLKVNIQSLTRLLKRINVSKLKKSWIKQRFVDKINNFEPLDPHNIWLNFKSKLYNSSREVLGHTNKKHQTAAQMKIKTVKVEVQKHSREIQNRWWKDKSAEIQRAADS